jgi:hypothetical protein
MLKQRAFAAFSGSTPDHYYSDAHDFNNPGDRITGKADHYSGESLLRKDSLGFDAAANSVCGRTAHAAFPSLCYPQSARSIN